MRAKGQNPVTSPQTSFFVPRVATAYPPGRRQDGVQRHVRLAKSPLLRHVGTRPPGNLALGKRSAFFAAFSLRGLAISATGGDIAGTACRARPLNSGAQRRHAGYGLHYFSAFTAPVRGFRPAPPTPGSPRFPDLARQRPAACRKSEFRGGSKSIPQARFSAIHAQYVQA